MVDHSGGSARRGAGTADQQRTLRHRVDLPIGTFQRRHQKGDYQLRDDQRSTGVHLRQFFDQQLDYDDRHPAGDHHLSHQRILHHDQRHEHCGFRDAQPGLRPRERPANLL